MSKYTQFSDAQIGMILSRPVLISGISEATAKNGKTFLKMKWNFRFRSTRAIRALQ